MPRNGKNLKTGRQEKGFTMVELIVVLGITTILASVAIPVYRGFMDNAKLVASASSLSRYRNGLEEYFFDYGDYPASIDFEKCTDGNGNRIVDPISCNYTMPL